MARKLKTYQTSQGFFDMAIAAPSMKAALEAWGANKELFHKGFAWESGDPRVIEATMKAPGVVLRRPVGSHGRFVKHAHLPKGLPASAPQETHGRPKKQTKGRAKKNVDPKTARKAAAAFEQEQRRRQREQRKEEAARQRERKRRQKLVDKVQAQLDAAEREHITRAAAIEKERDALDKRAAAEDARWDKVKERLERARQRVG